MAYRSVLIAIVASFVLAANASADVAPRSTVSNCYDPNTVFKFKVPELLPGGGAIAAGDFDGVDGVDLVTASYDSLTIRFNDGTGHFLRRANLDFAGYVSSLVTGDLDHDGRADVVAVLPVEDKVAILRMGPDGVPYPPIYYATGPDPSKAILGQLDEDTNLDLVVVNTTDNSIFVFFGRGDGSFDEPIRIEIGLSPLDLASADFDGDGRLDIAIADQDTFDPYSLAVTIVENLGGRAFAPPTTFPLTDIPPDSQHFIATADLDGDHRVDIIVGGDVGGIYHNDGGGLFTRVGSLEPIRHHSQGYSIADLDGDGVLEILVATGSSWLTIFRRAPSGDYVRSESYYMAYRASQVAVTDLDGDGMPDIVFSAENATGILRNDAGGRMAGYAFYRFDDDYPYVGGVRAVDGSRTGHADLFYSKDGETYRMANNGSGRFGAAVEFLDAVIATALDFDRDGVKNEFVTTNGPGVYRLNPDGHVEQIAQRADLTYMAYGDFNGDGWPDIVASDPQFNLWLLANTQGSGLADPTSLGLSLNAYPSLIATPDLDGDGWADLVTAENAWVDSMVVFKNVGGTLVPAGRFACNQPDPNQSGYPTQVLAADFDRDGRVDIAVCFGQIFVRRIDVFLNRGDGRFELREPFSIGFEPYAFEFVDLDLDGFPDVVEADHETYGVDAARGIGNGDFECAGLVTPGDGVLGPSLSLTVADFDGDGVADIANLYAYSRPGIGVLLNAATRDEPTPALVSAVVLSVEDSHVRIEWSGSGTAGREGIVERLAPGGAWTEVGRVAFDGNGRGTFVDQSVAPGLRYGYRLVMNDGRGAIRSDEVWADVPAAGGGLALASVFPNPAPASGFNVRFRLEDSSPARLEVLDVAGRLVSTTSVGSLGSGWHAAQLGAHDALRSGYYFVRLRAGSKTMATRPVLVTR